MFLSAANTKLLPAAVTHVRQITVSYPSVYCSVRYNSVTIACINCSHSGPEVGRWPSDLGGTVASRPTLATAGLLVWHQIHHH